MKGRERIEEEVWRKLMGYEIKFKREGSRGRAGVDIDS